MRRLPTTFLIVATMATGTWAQSERAPVQPAELQPAGLTGAGARTDAGDHGRTDQYRPQLTASGFADSEQSAMVAPYISRATRLFDEDDQQPQSITRLPMRYQPWWTQQVNSQLRPRQLPMHISLEDTVLSALTHSPKVRALRVEPTIRERSVLVERAQFDWLSFAEMTWDDTSDPVGNTLTTGGSPRFRDNKWKLENGLRRRTHDGGELEIAHQIGWQDNNSNFFVPAPQGTSRLSVNYTQPLLRQRGRFYNKSRIVLAKIDRGIADSESVVGLQDHLVDVSQTYWELFRARAALLQKQKLLLRAQAILERLEGRRAVDVLQRQILRARAAVSSRQSEIARAAASVRNAESRLRLLVNDPALLSGAPLELLPQDAPICEYVVYSTPELVTVGLMTRPDIARAIRQIRGQSVRLGVTKAEMLPKLDLILSTYLAGLEGNGDIWESQRNWFQQGEPGYSIGFSFEYPLGNRAAKAQFEQQRFRLQKAMLEFRNTVETGVTEVELAAREARTSHAEMLSRYEAMQAAEAEAIYLNERWRQLPGDDRTTAEMLEDLLDAQERVAVEEYAFETARMNYMLALIEIKRSTGTLLAAEDGASLLDRPGQLHGPEISPQSSPEQPAPLPPAAPADTP